MRTYRSEEGVGLIETMIAVAILGVAVASLVGGIYAYAVASDVHRRQATAGTVLGSFAEALKAESYVDCATAGSYTPAFEPPPGFTVSLDSVRYWSPETESFGASCVPGSDSGLQLLWISSSDVARNVSREIELVKRDGSDR